MRRDALHLVLAAVILLAGCTAPTGPSDTTDPTATSTPTATATPPPTATPQPVAVEYAVSAGTIPDDIESVEVTLQVVFVERAGDMGPCWRGTFTGPYKPTITPIAPPEGECYRSESVTLDLTALDGERSLGRITAPGRFTAGHALIATNVTATYRNGTTVTGIKDASGKRVRVVDGPPAGPYRVTLSLQAYDDRPYDYWFVTEEN
ncbi:hypothetical protein [Haloplanus aerogenes]|uniref:Uncharacterized protein n=1 Tax=Haloplanus aerogenes TaxID=660522 RepID=A0A3M0CW12_9EURY|nr:hypothetical protein [Haloplanus aerogenes]AZH24076.1 hypothetical protein DU502_01215 [Haloplanus aerogenes]RMB13147.1 hypothetical protein ATH50_2478 [Haloplanus aerogenes]